MILGSAPVGAIPVGAAPGSTTTVVLLTARAQLGGSGNARTIVRASTKGAASLLGSGHTRLVSGASLVARASLIGSGHGRLGIRSVSLKGTALLMLKGGAKPVLVNPHFIGTANNLGGFASAKAGLTAITIPIFPVLAPLAWSVHKKPISASRVTTAITGRENQLAATAYPRWAFTLTYGGSSWLRDQTQNISPDMTKLGYTEFEQLSGLFIFVKGAFGEFYYNDPDDNSRLTAPIGQGNGSATSFPIYVPWGYGPFSPSFFFPVGGINTIDAVYINGAIQPSTSYSVDFTRTQLVFNSAPPSGSIITADFHFYYRCRFLDDHLDFSQWAKNLWECAEVRFESVKP